MCHTAGYHLTSFTDIPFRKEDSAAESETFKNRAAVIMEKLNPINIIIKEQSESSEVDSKIDAVRKASIANYNYHYNIVRNEVRQNNRIKKMKQKQMLLNNTKWLCVAACLLVLPGCLVGLVSYTGYLFGGAQLIAESFYWFAPIINPWLYIYMNKQIKNMHQNFMKKQLQKWKNKTFY